MGRQTPNMDRHTPVRTSLYRNFAGGNNRLTSVCNLFHHALCSTWIYMIRFTCCGIISVTDVQIDVDEHEGRIVDGSVGAQPSCSESAPRVCKDDEGG